MDRPRPASRSSAGADPRAGAGARPRQPRRLRARAGAVLARPTTGAPTPRRWTATCRNLVTDEEKLAALRELAPGAGAEARPEGRGLPRALPRAAARRRRRRAPRGGGAARAKRPAPTRSWPPSTRRWRTSCPAGRWPSGSTWCSPACRTRSWTIPTRPRRRSGRSSSSTPPTPRRWTRWPRCSAGAGATGSTSSRWSRSSRRPRRSRPRKASSGRSARVYDERLEDPDEAATALHARAGARAGHRDAGRAGRALPRPAHVAGRGRHAAAHARPRFRRRGAGADPGGGRAVYEREIGDDEAAVEAYRAGAGVRPAQPRGARRAGAALHQAGPAGGAARRLRAAAGADRRTTASR